MNVLRITLCKSFPKLFSQRHFVYSLPEKLCISLRNTGFNSLLSSNSSFISSCIYLSLVLKCLILALDFVKIRHVLVLSLVKAGWYQNIIFITSLLFAINLTGAVNVIMYNRQWIDFDLRNNNSEIITKNSCGFRASLITTTFSF